MSLPSTFQERLHKMEETRNQRLSLLQTEKELQIEKSKILSRKLAGIRGMEQRRLLLEKRNAELGFQILARKSEIDALESRYQDSARQFRHLKCEIGELEARESERDQFYEVKRLEMEEFEEIVRKYVTETQQQVQELGISVAQLKETLRDLQDKDEITNNAEITAAEARKAELLVRKQKLEISLASNYQLRALLQKQLQKTLNSQESEKKKQKLASSSDS